MNQASSATPHRHSRLVRLLSDFAMVDDDWAYRDFADRLGQMLSFNDSIILSDAHKAKPERGFQRHTESAEDVKQEVLRTKATLVNNVIQSCTSGDGKPRIRWPVVDAESASGYEPFLRFYSAHQREQDLAIRVVRSAARDALSACSPALKKLALLDQALDDTLWEQIRRFYGVIPRLLERRFNLLRDQQPLWLNQFRKDIQALLLAELDLRLQPVLGLVEALEKEVIRNP
ncbi:DUF3348 family protein [Ketobacter alkanivorans]|uniref:DUF3348 domain-containing protein n=1 Tax=Ketobacter alkanivorans TaxID=1917421 RepID=A0A2K9LPN8_9GAMM|nr:DUF3348 family protein [Ketobacter alkanivorans]AUM14190.1 hypothetical protein Kalk_17960 [Ketobacter alkanivorans]